MNWKKWLTYNPYKKLWSLIGGRPWTFILRDTWHNFEGIWVIGLVAIGAILSYYFGLQATLIGLGIFLVGFIFGHLFWGKPYIEGQEGK